MSVKEWLKEIQHEFQTPLVDENGITLFGALVYYSTAISVYKFVFEEFIKNESQTD